jgi:4-hydroxymandelate oxidase
VSNRGGRTLDTISATAHLLADVAACLRPHMTVLVDGAIRRGTDILNALALGTHAVLVGRYVIAGLTCAGASGAAHVLRLLLDEFEMAMSLCGCHSPLVANSALIHRTADMAHLHTMALH